MSSPKAAPCPLLFKKNGGEIDERGRPVFKIDKKGNYPLRSLCSQAFDCGTCPLLKEYVEEETAKGYAVGWECNDCLHESFMYERRNPEVDRVLPGFFQAGSDPDLPEDHKYFDPDRPPLKGCTSCGKGTSFLQLVLRKAR